MQEVDVGKATNKTHVWPWRNFWIVTGVAAPSN